MSNLRVPLLFPWKVARAGYHWIKAKDGRRLCAKDAVQPDWHNFLDRYETIYHPLEQRTGLFLEFVQLEPNEEQILTFANRYGLLTDGENCLLDTEFGSVPAHGEVLKLWRDEIRDFKFAVYAWSTLLSGDEKQLNELRAIAPSNLPVAARHSAHLDDERPAVAVLSMIQRIIDPRLRSWVEVRLLFEGDQPQLSGRLMPQNLIGALWLQFAAAVDAHKKFLGCQQCGTPFELSREPQTGKRRDARYCSDRCRVAHYRARIEQAQHLRSKGLKPGEIARELGTQARIVNRWLRGRGRL